MAHVPRRPLVWALLAAITARIVFWLYTGRVWEDALITLTPVRNLFSGNGLTYHVGDGHVFSYTSAISVLIPIAGEVVGHGLGLTALRLASVAGAIAALVFAAQICARLELGRWPSGFVLAYLALDQWQIFFGMAGMETQVAVAVLLGGMYFALQERFALSGIFMGLSLLARPDFVIWVACESLYMGLTKVRKAALALALTVAVIGPWLLFTALYYGSIIPQTILAKDASYDGAQISPLHPASVLPWLVQRLQLHHGIWRLFSPFYENSFVLRAPLPRAVMVPFAAFVMVLAIVGAVVTWRIPPWRPAIAFAGIFVVYRVLLLPPVYFEWYLPPFLAVTAILAGAGLERLGTTQMRSFQPAAAVLLAVAFAAPMLWTFPLDARIQHSIEEKVRVPIGMYLQRRVRPGQHVATESAGFIGYYSGAALYDFPGLTSTVSLRTLRTAAPGQRTLPYLISSLEPEWAVVRPAELTDLATHYPSTRAKYVEDRHFKVSVSTSIAGLDEANIDRDFVILRRKDVVNG